MQGLRPFVVGYAGKGGCTSEQELLDILVALLTGEWASLGERGEEDEPLIQAIATFEEAGVGNGGATGLVITTGDGSVFRVSIARNS